MENKIVFNGVKIIGWYDVYDSNDNLIASDVWINEDTGSGEPIVINWYKVFTVILFIIKY